MEELLIDNSKSEPLESVNNIQPLSPTNIIESTQPEEKKKKPKSTTIIPSKLILFNLFFIIIIFVLTISSFNYINFFNTLFIHLLIIFLFTNMDDLVLKLKRILTLIIIIMNLIYTIVFGCTLIIIKSNTNVINDEIKHILQKIFLFVSENKCNYMNFGICLLMSIVLLIYYKLSIWDINTWNDKEEKDLEKLLQKCSIFKNQFLSFGLYFICLGASFFPTTFNCFFLLLVLSHFGTLIFKKSWHRQFKKYISFIFCCLIPCFISLNYIANVIINDEQFYNNISSSYYGFIILYEKDNSSIFLYKIKFLHLLPCILYLLGYIFINFYIDLPINSQSQNKNLNEIQGNDIDSALYAFFKESEKLNVFGKIKLFIFKYCYSPSFFLHFCRFGVIIWINTYVTYSSYFMIIWVLISMTYSETKLFFKITKNILLPLLIVSLSLGYVCNIQGVEFELEELGMKKYKTQEEVFYHMTLGITIITILQSYIHMKIKFTAYNKLHTTDLLDEGDSSQNKLDMSTKYVLELFEIVFKFSIVAIDCGLIVFLYFSICQSINIFNEIMLLFIISLFVYSNEICKYYKLFLILLNMTFQLKYLVSFMFRVNSKEVYSNNIYNFLSILFYDELKRPYYYWTAYYLLYINYVNQQSQIFRICRQKNFSIYELIENKFHHHINIRYLLNTICDFLFGIYIWLLIPCLIIFLLLQENNLFFLIQLLITFIIYYKYIKITGINYKRLHGIFFYTKLMITTSIIFLSAVYISQFLNKKPFSLWFALTDIRTKRKLELIGFFVFNGNYSFNFIAYIFQFLISVALHVEIKRQIALSNSRKKLNKDRITSNKRTYSFNIRRSSISKGKTIFNKSYMKKLYTLLYYILHYYWIVIFIVVAILSIHWMLSISMAIELILFSYYIMKSFLGYYKCLNTNNSNSLSNKQTFSLRMKEYKAQRQEHLKITSDNQESYYNVIWRFTFTFIILAYMSSIALKFLENKIIIKYFSAGMYMLGFYNESKTNFITYSSGYFVILALFSVRAYIMSKLNELVNKDDLQKTNKTTKTQKYSIFPKTKQILMFNDENNDKENLNELQEPLFLNNKIDKDFLINQEASLDMLNDINDNNNNSDDNEDNNNERRNSFDDSDTLKQFNKIMNTGDFPNYFSGVYSLNQDSSFSNKSDLIDSSEEDFLFKRSDSICISKGDNNNNILNESRISFRPAPSSLSKYKERNSLVNNNNNNFFQKKCKDDIDIRYQTKSKKGLSHSLAIQIGCKHFIEILLVCLVLANAVIKMNILSFIFIICVIRTYGSKVITIKLMFNISLIILTLFIIQYLLFLSNISYDTNPFVDNAILSYVEDVFYLPWCKRIIGFKWASFFSCGVIRYHINSLWIDVIILILFYFYLEFFSFSIYENQSNEEQSINYEKYFWKFKNAKNISSTQLRNLQRSMKLSYDIELAPKLGSTNFSVRNKTYAANENTKLKSFKKIRSFLYLSFHYFSLVFILLVALLNRGLISLGYTTFSIYYIYKANNFLQGRSWTFARGIRLFLKPYLFLEIILQFVFQIPLDVFKLFNQQYLKYMDIVGFSIIMDYSSTYESINKNGLFVMMLKVLMYFIILIQEVIYNSAYFKQFILKYHYKYIQIAYISGTLHSFLFNNYRVKLMNDRLEERDEINDTLKKVEGMIIKWNNSFNTRQDGMGSITMNKTITSGNEIYKKKLKKKKDEMNISQILRKYWMIAMATNFYLESRYVNQSKIRDKNEILRILNGGIVMNSLLDDQIEKFESDNYDKYAPALERIRNIKKKNKEEQKNNADLMKNISPENIQTITPGEDGKDKVTKIQSEISTENLIDNNDDLLIPSQLSKSTIITSKSSQEINYRCSNSISQQQDQDESFFASCDYFEIKAQIRREFFAKYYSKSKLLMFIIKSNFHSLKENFEYVCYFFMIINHFKNCSLISVVWPILVFIFGITQYPRPEKLYWKLCMIYCSSVIIVKFFFQLNIWEQFDTFSGLFESKNEYIKRIGIKQFTALNSNEFVVYVFYDFLLLCTLLTNQFMLIRKGLWNETEIEYETIEEANTRINKFQAKNYKNNTDEFNTNIVLSNEEIVELIGKVKNKGKSSFTKQICDFYSKTFTSVRNEKPGRDYYLYYTIIQFFILVYIIIFYTQMEQDKLIIDLETFQVNQFSGKMVLFAFIHLLLLVFDRFIFLKNSRKVKKIAYKIYSKQTGEDVTTEFSNQYNITNNYEKAKIKCEQQSDLYNIVCYQFEGTQVGLIFKFLVQVFTVLLIHFYVFCYFPIQGNINLQTPNEQTNNEFLSNPFLIAFYILYIGYFIFSGMQIKYGLPDMRKKSSLMAGSNVFFSVCFKGFKAVPFLFELKNFIDWTFTATAFDIFKWLKYEEIFALLYINKCFAKSYMGIRVGSKSPLYMKIGIGGSLVTGVLLVIFVPLVLFSTLNPSNSPNDVVSAKLKLELCLGNSTQTYNVSLLKSTNAHFSAINDTEYETFLNNTESKGYTRQQIQKVNIVGYSEKMWDISSKTYDMILNQINEDSTARLVLKISVTRQKDPTTSENNYVVYSSEKLGEIKTFFYNNNNALSLKELKSDSVQIGEFYSKHMKVPSEGGPSILINTTKSDIFLKLNCDSNNGFRKEIHWSISNKKEGEEYIEFITFSDLYSSATAGYNILTFYVAIVLVVGQYMRLILMGQAERVIYTEMVNPNKLLTLCEGIRISRIKKDFLQEDRLYYLLIDIMRSPEMMKNITKSSLVFIQEGNIIKDDTKAKVTEIESLALLAPFNERNRKAFK